MTTEEKKAKIEASIAAVIKPELDKAVLAENAKSQHVTLGAEPLTTAASELKESKQ